MLYAGKPRPALRIRRGSPCCCCHGALPSNQPNHPPSPPYQYTTPDSHANPRGQFLTCRLSCPWAKTCLDGQSRHRSAADATATELNHLTQPPCGFLVTASRETIRNNPNATKNNNEECQASARPIQRFMFQSTFVHLQVFSIHLHSIESDFSNCC